MNRFYLQVSNRWTNLVTTLASLISLIIQLLTQLVTHIWLKIVNRPMKELPRDLINFIRNIRSQFYSPTLKNDIFTLKSSVADALSALKEFLFWNPLIIFQTPKQRQQKPTNNNNHTNNSRSNNSRINSSTDASPNSSSAASPSTRKNT